MARDRVPGISSPCRGVTRRPLGRRAFRIAAGVASTGAHERSRQRGVALLLLKHLSAARHRRTSPNQILREVFNLTFVTGSPVPVVDVIGQVLAVPCPTAASGQVRARRDAVGAAARGWCGCMGHAQAVPAFMGPARSEQLAPSVQGIPCPAIFAFGTGFLLGWRRAHHRAAATACRPARRRAELAAARGDAEPPQHRGPICGGAARAARAAAGAGAGVGCVSSLLCGWLAHLGGRQAGRAVPCSAAVGQGSAAVALGARGALWCSGGPPAKPATLTPHPPAEPPRPT
jgi:hypothetical protein